MSDIDYRDNLIDALLHAELGGDAPPDLSARILARASRWRNLRWPLAIAAALLIILGLALWFMHYPAPQLDGLATITGAPQLQRGASIHTDTTPATLTLGGYARIALEPNTQLTLEGDTRKESIFLAGGQIRCDIQPNHGTFAVRSTVGSAEVKGTSFTVRIVQEKGDDDMFHPKMTVHVLAGLVLVTSASTQTLVHAGEEISVPHAVDAPADGQAKASQPIKTGGVITKIENQSITFSIKGDGQEKESTITVDNKTAILIPTNETTTTPGDDGQPATHAKLAPAKLEDLKPGQQIFALCRQDNSAIRITVVTPEK